MFKLLKDIGCLTIIVLAGILFYNIFNDIENHTPSKDVRADPNARPDELTIDMMFRKADRDHLRKKFGPKANIDKAGSTRLGNHRDGWLFVHEFRGHDELGHPVETVSGLLYKTNAATAWTYYDSETLPDILKETTVNGKPLVK